MSIAAYDGLVFYNLRKNVTKENLNITTEEKRWAISTNNVNVTSSSATYSDSLTSLKCNFENYINTSFYYYNYYSTKWFFN